MKKLIYVTALSALLLAACGGEETAKKEETNNQITITETSEDEFMSYASNITGRTFIKNMVLNDNYSVIDFYGSFEEYKTDNPDSLIQESDYRSYFDTGEAIQKILVIENIRLLREFPGLTGAKMTLPFDGKTYSISLDRTAINDHLGFKVEELNTDDNSWNTKFLDPIGYNDQKREEIFNKFGSIN